MLGMYVVQRWKLLPTPWSLFSAVREVRYTIRRSRFRVVSGSVHSLAIQHLLYNILAFCTITFSPASSLYLGLSKQHVSRRDKSVSCQVSALLKLRPTYTWYATRLCI
ncbi:hypothetical protein EJ05DRAFT_337471 [Pseudovirgaria hyperparasitica]|uniref:Uncharacterized protein n=1 Tax=Pseudovirgaria hyperparasitica TaxID=470096 RepID=A0A6A6W985_9PEZI|nr:uncharacterized protein EJ05DRAFT_337471 [Pseudovirgaria hyperparasitica]KAF2759223.1 hypothetical protein EJ05DRAFT_337471 [Pseudovirgaria hyperparasitica]